MPYGLLGLLISLVLLTSFVLSGDVSIRSKLTVAAAFAIALVLQQFSQQWALAGVLLQIVLAIGLLMRLKGKG